MESFKTARKRYKPVEALDHASDVTNQILLIARQAGCTPKMRGSKIRIYKDDTPVVQIRAATSETPSVFIHIHASRPDEKKRFFTAVNLAEHPERVWKQPPGWTPYKYVGDSSEIARRIKEVLPALLRRVKPVRETAVYRGVQAKTGNSLGLRFERALFQSHPEFNGEVEARVIAPGRMLVVARADEKAKGKEEDPVLSSFMSFLAADMQRSPEHIAPLDDALIKRAGRLVSDNEPRLEEDLGDEALI